MCCEKIIQSTAVIEGKRRNLSNRIHCLECLPWKTRFPKKIKTDNSDKDALRAKWVRYSVNRRMDIKAKCVSHLGGSCISCGYNRCLRALEFHHVFPEEKTFGISDGATRAWDKVEIELSKCVLLCSNCHREAEDGIIPRSDLIPFMLDKPTTKSKHVTDRRHCLDCGNKMWKGSIGLYCINCTSGKPKPELRKVERPSLQDLLNQLEESSYTEVARRYGVVCNTIRKWIKSYGEVPPRKRKIR